MLGSKTLQRDLYFIKLGLVLIRLVFWLLHVRSIYLGRFLCVLATKTFRCYLFTRYTVSCDREDTVAASLSSEPRGVMIIRVLRITNPGSHSFSKNTFYTPRIRHVSVFSPSCALSEYT